MIKKMIGTKPAIIGEKVPVTFFGSLEENYLEICIDVARGSQMANSICNACKGAADAISVGLAFVVEGQKGEDLPEQVLSVFRLHHVSMNNTYHRAQWYKELERNQYHRA